jgi:hypothetical protein
MKRVRLAGLEPATSRLSLDNPPPATREADENGKGVFGALSAELQSPSKYGGTIRAHDRHDGDSIAFGPRESRSPNASSATPPPADHEVCTTVFVHRLSNSDCRVVLMDDWP